LIADQSACDESYRSDGSSDASITCSGANNRTVPAPAPVPKGSSRKKEFERKIALEPLRPSKDESEERTRRALPDRQRRTEVMAE